MDPQTLNSLLGASALGLSAYILFKVLTTQFASINRVEYNPLFGWVDNINPNEYTHPDPIMNRSKPIGRLSDGTMLYEQDDKIYVYEQ
jgi:hypothetical protein